MQRFWSFFLELAHLLLTGLVFVVALAAAVAAEPLPKVSGAAVECAWLETLAMGSSDTAALLRSAAEVERRAAKSKTLITHRLAICTAGEHQNQNENQQLCCPVCAAKQGI